jgi:hypothetical protein
MVFRRDRLASIISMHRMITHSFPKFGSGFLLQEFTIINKKNVVKIRLNFYFCSQGIQGMFVASLIAAKEEGQGLSCFPLDERFHDNQTGR